jgi:hypothetical protein
MKNSTYDAIIRELNTARENFPDMSSEHEGYAIILEELDEAWDEIKKSPSKRDPKRVRAEMIQVAAMAIRFLDDLT